MEPISHYCLSGQHSYTRGPLADTNALISESTVSKYHAEKSSILNLIAALSGYTSYYITTNACMILSICYNLQNPQWSDEYSVYKIKPGINLMFELHVTMYLHRTACSLSDVDSHFFPSQKNSCSCSLLNVCTFVQQYIGTNVRLS